MKGAAKQRSGAMRKVKKKSKQNKHKKSMLLISLILLMLSGVLGVHSITLQSRNKIYQQQESELLAQIKEQEQRAAEIAEYEAFVNTDEYVKKVAEEKLGLVDPNEIIFKPVD